MSLSLKKTNTFYNQQENFSIQSQETIHGLIQLLNEKNAALIAHYYTDPEIQSLADASGGFIGDSLAMAAFGANSPASTLVVAGVRFMGENAKILSPHKQILMPTLEATCSLDLSCPPDQFTQFCDEHPEYTVVVYCNTSAAVKARADWVVTSSNALEIIDYLHGKGHKILWAPDRYLGHYIQKQLGIKEMLIWQGACIVHEEFKAEALKDLREAYPEAAVLVHPESPAAIVEQADVVGSTSQLLNAVTRLNNPTFIVATDRGIFYKMQQRAPLKTFIEAPTAGRGATCKSCAHCPWMAMNQLDSLSHSLKTGDNEVTIDPVLLNQAKIPLTRMLNFSIQS